MSDRDLIDAVAQKTGEDSNEIRRRGFMLSHSVSRVGFCLVILPFPAHTPDCSPR